MKKLLLVFLAAFLAVGFSAFTTDKLDGAFYKNPGSETLLPTTVSICVASGEDCIEPVPEENFEERQIYNAAGQKLKRQ